MMSVKADAAAEVLAYSSFPPAVRVAAPVALEVLAVTLVVSAEGEAVLEAAEVRADFNCKKINKRRHDKIFLPPFFFLKKELKKI